MFDVFKHITTAKVAAVREELFHLDDRKRAMTELTIVTAGGMEHKILTEGHGWHYQSEEVEVMFNFSGKLTHWRKAGQTRWMAVSTFKQKNPRRP